MPDDTAATTELPPPAPAPTFFEKLKAEVLKIETEALNEAHSLEIEALNAEHALITDAETLFARIRSKL